MARVGNAWVSAAQSLLNEYSLRRQTIAAGGVYEGPMDDRSYEIISRTKEDAINVGRIFDTVTGGPNPPYKLFTMYDSDVSLKGDLDYMQDTWGNDFIVQGSWWSDTGTQGGMQEGEDGDPPTGDPFYPIRNNLYLFMPEEVGAISNDDLEDINLMIGQAPRDFTQYAVPAIDLTRAEGDINIPAVFTVTGNWHHLTHASFKIEIMNGGSGEQTFEYQTPTDQTDLAVAEVFRLQIDDSILFTAIRFLQAVIIRPESPTHTIKITDVEVN